MPVTSEHRSRPTAGALPGSKAGSGSTIRAPSRRWSHPTRISTSPAGSSLAGSTRSSIPAATRWSSAWGMSQCAISSVSCATQRKTPQAPVQSNAPMRGAARKTGRCLRDFVYRGFNADTEGRKVFDGILPHVAGAGRKWLNHRFANANVSGGQQHEDHFNIADSFPFSYAESTDHLTGRQDAILKRPETDPLVIHTQTSTEYWQRRGSLVHTDTRGNDLPQPPGVRVYLWASSQHFADPIPPPLERGLRQNYLNTVATSMLFRAMIEAMNRWATHGIVPPDSRVPRRADGTLVTFEEWRG